MLGLICFCIFRWYRPSLCERAFRSRLTLREEGQVELSWGRRLTDLARVQAAKKSNTLSTKKCRVLSYIAARPDKRCFQLFHKRRQLFIGSYASAQPSQHQTHRELVYRPFQFHKRSWQFIGTHDETLSVAVMRISNPVKDRLFRRLRRKIHSYAVEGISS